MLCYVCIKEPAAWVSGSFPGTIRTWWRTTNLSGTTTPSTWSSSARKIQTLSKGDSFTSGSTTFAVTWHSSNRLVCMLYTTSPVCKFQPFNDRERLRQSAVTVAWQLSLAWNQVRSGHFCAIHSTVFISVLIDIYAPGLFLQLINIRCLAWSQHHQQRSNSCFLGESGCVDSSIFWHPLLSRPSSRTDFAVSWLG